MFSEFKNKERHLNLRAKLRVSGDCDFFREGRLKKKKKLEEDIYIKKCLHMLLYVAFLYVSPHELLVLFAFPLRPCFTGFKLEGETRKKMDLQRGKCNFWVTT